jgi:hypothetical protein
MKNYFKKNAKLNIYHVRNMVNVYYFVIAENITEHLELVLDNIIAVTKFANYILGDPELCEKYEFIIQYAILNSGCIYHHILAILIRLIPYEILVEKYPDFMFDPDCKYINYTYDYENIEFMPVPYLKSYAERINSCRKHEKLVRAIAKYTKKFEPNFINHYSSIDVIVDMNQFVN